MQYFDSFQEFYYRGMSVLDKISSEGGRDVKYLRLGSDFNTTTGEFHVSKEDIDEYKQQFKLLVTDLFTIDKTGRIDTGMFIDGFCFHNGEGVIDPDKMLCILDKYNTMPVSSVSRQIGLMDAVSDMERNFDTSEVALEKAIAIGNCFGLGDEFLALSCTDNGVILNSNYNADTPIDGRSISLANCNVPSENISIHIDPGKGSEFNAINIENDVRDSRIVVYTGKDVFLRGSFHRCSINSASNITEACHKCVLDMNYGDAFSSNVAQVMQSGASFSKDTVSGVVLDSSKGDCDKDVLYERLKKSYDITDEDILDLAPERTLELEYVKHLSPDVTPIDDKKLSSKLAWDLDMFPLYDDEKEKDPGFEI